MAAAAMAAGASRGGQLTLALVALLGSTEAWGPDGHAVVAHVATSLLQPQVLQVLDNELGKTNLSEASNWCDHYCHTEEGRWSSPLHYINYPGRACSFNWTQDCPDDWCNVGALVNFTKQVFDRSLPAEQRQQALFFVIHLAGDLHQPLHVSSEDDMGGNDIKITFDFSSGGGSATQADNLHSVWDVDLITQEIADLQKEMLTIGGGPQPYHSWPVLAQSLLKRMTEGTWREEVAQWRRSVAVNASGLGATGPKEEAFRARLGAVAEDTAELSCSYGYSSPGGKDTISGDFLDRSYFLWAMPVVEVQLAKAGARLAQLLSDAFAAAEAAEASVLVI